MSTRFNSFYLKNDGDMCEHLKIAYDKICGHYKCINCYTEFYFKNKKQYLHFRSRIVGKYDFKKSPSIQSCQIETKIQESISKRKPSNLSYESHMQTKIRRVNPKKMYYMLFVLLIPLISAISFGVWKGLSKPNTSPDINENVPIIGNILPQKTIAFDETNETKKIINFNEKINDLKVVEIFTTMGITVDINNELKEIVIQIDKNFSGDHYSVAFFSEEYQLKEVLIVSIKKEKFDIGLSKNKIDLIIENNVLPAATITYSDKIKNLKLKSQKPSFLDININESNKEIKLNVKQAGSTSLVFGSDNAVSDETVEVKVTEKVVEKPVIEIVADQALFEKDGSKNVLLSIKNPIANELPVIKSSVEKVAKVEYNSNLKAITITPLSKGKTVVTISYKNTDSVSFNLEVYESINISKFDRILGFVEGYANKNTDLDLNATDKSNLIKEFFKQNGYANISDDIVGQIQLSNFHVIQGQKINRKFNLKANSNSTKVNGSLDDVFIRVAPLDLSDSANQIKESGNFITQDFLSMSDVDNPVKVEESILKQFMSLNKDLNPMKLEDIQIRKGTAVISNQFSVVIEAKKGQNNVSKEIKYTFGGFYINGTNVKIDIVKMFNS